MLSLLECPDRAPCDFGGVLNSHHRQLAGRHLSAQGWSGSNISTIQYEEQFQEMLRTVD